MDKIIRAIYKKALTDQQFLTEIYEVDGDTKPAWWATSLEKQLFAMCYYGYLVGKGETEFISELKNTK